MMKTKLSRLSERYMAALRKHLKQGPNASLQLALGLGRQAVTLGLEILDVARIHERVLTELKSSSSNKGPLKRKRAEIFFDKAITPIVETHRAARHSKVRLNQARKTLARRTNELALTKRELQRGIVRRKVIEHAAVTSRKHYQKCLEESLELQKRLRQLTHRVLAAQEDERKKISRELQNEIAQTLLGINVRLLSLKQGGRIHTQGLKNEIAGTQRLVVKSAKSIRRVACKSRNA
jgi:signal transduction histidine kinase